MVKEGALNSGDRLRALFVVWTACTVMAVSMMIFRVESTAAGLALTFVTALATLMITRVPNTVETTTDSNRISAKAKRSDTALIDRLIDSMSDAEVAALRKRLMEDDRIVSDDGEIVSLDALKAGKNASRYDAPW
jgi:hypothetical protein